MEDKTQKWLIANIILLTLLGVVLTMAACAVKTNAPFEVEIYLDTVHDLTGVLPTIEIRIVDTLPPDLPRNAIGSCGQGKILFLKRYWASATDLDREQLVLHEVGHCVFGLGHKNDTIMDPIHLPLAVYKKHRQHYLNQWVEMIQEAYKNRGKN